MVEAARTSTLAARSLFEISRNGLRLGKCSPDRLEQQFAFMADIFSLLEWTEGDRLRHSKFVVLREDKDAKKVVKEQTGKG